MKKYLTKRNIYIALFTVLYLMVGIVSLIHSFAFFGLANSYPMAVMLGVCFEIGQVAVLMSLLTSKKEQSRVMPWVMMCVLTLVQILGNVFSSYKYLMTHSVADLKYFKEPVFVWTTLPDNVTTVIITYVVGGILPLISLCMCGLVSNYIIDIDPDDNKNLAENDDEEVKPKIEEQKPKEPKPNVEIEQEPKAETEPNPQMINEIAETPLKKEDVKEEPQQEVTNHFVNL